MWTNDRVGVRMQESCSSVRRRIVSAVDYCCLTWALVSLPLGVGCRRASEWEADVM